MFHGGDGEVQLGVEEEVLPDALVVHFAYGLAAVADGSLGVAVLNSVAVILTAMSIVRP